MLETDARQTSSASADAIQPTEKPVQLSYKADLCGNIEQALKGLQGYGVMALELIQNADDAGARTLTFDARQDALVLSNDAHFSSCGLSSVNCPWERSGDPRGVKRACNFHAISTMGGRNKIHVAEQIGRFGIGFVSVYQITDTPIVRSIGTELRLNPLTGVADPRLVDASEGTEFELPWASEPSDIRNALNASPTPPDVARRVIDEVTAGLRSSLLFLRHLERVEIRESGIIRMTANIKRKAGTITLELGPDRVVEKWIILSREAVDVIADRSLMTRFEALAKLDRSTTVSVAIPANGAPIDGRLYAYLPTQHPTGMQLHINADFFPHASRQEIVLKGEGHERYWNEALLATAAAIIGENFLEIRNTLGHSRLWQLGSDAFELRETSAFAEFWTRFSMAAKSSDSVWAATNQWCHPVGVHMCPESMPEVEQAATGSLGLSLLHQSLRRHWTVLSQIGVVELRLLTVVTQIEAFIGAGVEGTNQHLKHLWAAVARLIDIAQNRTGFDVVIKRLKAAIFLIDIGGSAACPDAVRRTPDGVLPKLIRRYVPECPIVHPDVLNHPELVKLIREYALDDLAKDLARILTGNEAAEQLIGTQQEGIRNFYSLLTSFPTDPTIKAGSILANTALLRTTNSFIAPLRGKMPGGFTDPTGYFEFVDDSLFPPGMADFARDVLNVTILSFHQYIDDHLEDILARGLTREQYQTLLKQIVEHKNELEDKGSLNLVADRAFVRTRAGTFVRPNECYFWTAPLEALLGYEGLRWVDQTWMPPAPIYSRVQDLLESRLGMPTTVAARHIVNRLKEIANEGSPDEVAEAVTPIVRHLIERWARLADDDLAVLKELKNLKFLPAVVNGERDQNNLYLPTDVYRAGRAPGFASQVPVIDLAPLRQSVPTVNDVLDLLGVRPEPETKIIVAHLLHCIANGTAPSDLTYAMLSERVENNNDVAAIDELRGSTFIYDGDLQRFLNAGQVFWQTPPFRDYWWSASGRMSQRGALYRQLGVRDYPVPENYVELMLHIAGKPDTTEADVGIHSQCLTSLCQALDNGDPDAEAVINELNGQPSLLNIDGDAIMPENAVWIDSDHLAAPFGAVLNDRLVEHPKATRSGAARLFHLLGVRALSEVARLRLASEPDRIPAEQATESLRGRADLLLWLAPNPASYRKLRSILSRVRIQLTETLRIQAEIDEFDPPVRSRAEIASAFHEPEAGVLHVRGSALRLNEWVAAFRAIFSEIERDCPLTDMKPLFMTAAMILVLENREEAEQALRSSDFRPPDSEANELPLGQELRDSTDDKMEETDTSSSFDDNQRSEVTDDEARRDQGDVSQNTAESASQVDLDSPRNDAATNRTDSASGTEPQQNAGQNGSYTPGDHSTGEYKSKAGTDTFGANQDGSSSRNGGSGDQSGTGASGSSQTQADRTNRPGGGGERKARTSRMLAYVARAGDRGVDDAERRSDTSDISGMVDTAAIKAALKYEEKRGWLPQEQPHGNPGYDILSTAPDGRRRLIEVKGLEADWTERGIKLSHVQFRMAEDYPDEFWIYIVENARDLDRQKVSAIGNPFQKVEEYWFDQNWRDTCEETASWRDLNVHVGARVKHATWGTGSIVDVVQRGISTLVKVDFGSEGMKFIPFNSNLQIID